MSISQQIKDIFDQHKNGPRIFALATADKKGIPNVVPIGFLWVANDEEIWVVDNYLNKTLANIKANPVAAVYAMGGENYEAAKEMAHSVNPNYPAKGLVKIKVSCAFNTTPGPEAGNKI